MQPKVIDSVFSEDDFSDLLNATINSSYFPVYRNDNQVSEDSNSFFSHTILARKGEEKNGERCISKGAMPIVIALLSQLGEAHVEILRASFNTTFNTGADKKYGIWHDDHEELDDYNHLIFYLTTNPNAPTEIKYNGETVSVDAVANRAVVFNKCLHRATMPDYGLRSVIVITYI